MAPAKPRLTIKALGNGLYRVTTVLEPLEAQEVKRLYPDLELPPEPPVPWSPQRTHQVAHRADPREPVDKADREAALAYWSRRVGPPGHRLNSNISHLLREHGLEVVLAAMERAAVDRADAGLSVKYTYFLYVLREGASKLRRKEDKPP
jgi:hypothetical protein